MACCRVGSVARTEWVMPMFQAAVHGASPATKVATAGAIISLDRVRRRPSVDLAVRCFCCLTYVLLAHKCQLSSKDQAHHTDNTTTLQATRPHYISKCSAVSHHKKVVWYGCGVCVVCLVFRRRLPLVGQIWCKSVHGGLLFYLYLFSSTHLQVRPVGGFSRLMAQTTRTRERVWCIDFNQIWHNDIKWSSWVVQISTQQIQNGGRPPF